MAVIGSASAFIESTLAQVYKTKDGKDFRGGPSYYMEKALGKLVRCDQKSEQDICQIKSHSRFHPEFTDDNPYKIGSCR